MQFEISPEILAATTKCPKEFLCLTQPETLCQVEYSVGDQLFFVHRPSKGQCPYLKHFGEKCYCECPTRKEIFKRYHR